MLQDSAIPNTDFDKREIGYYSTPSYIAEYLVNSMLDLRPNGHTVLEPAVGKEELIQNFPEAMHIDGYDVYRYKETYEKCTFILQDFIETYIKEPQILREKHYDYIIMNPPFVDHEHTYIRNNKEILKENFKYGISNLFSLFLTAIIDIAENGCVMGVIIPDTLLYSKTYQPIRDYIIQTCSIHQIILCPEAVFRKEGANISPCILILQKGKIFQQHIKILTRLRDRKSFEIALLADALTEINLFDIIVNVGDHTIFSLNCFPEIRNIINGNPRLGSIYKCCGGVSTGNDKLYTSQKKIKGYTLKFYQNPANQRFFAKPNSFLCDDFIERHKKVPNFIIRNKDTYENPGIACTSIGKRFSAVYLPAKAVHGVNAGIFPPEEDIPWLLAYLNSSLVTYILKSIFARGIMTTIGSVASIPLISFSAAEKIDFAEIVEKIKKRKISKKKALKIIDNIIFDNLALSDEARLKIHTFCSDLTHLV